MKRPLLVSLSVIFLIVFCSLIAHGQSGRLNTLHTFNVPATPTAFSSDGKVLAIVVGDKVQLRSIHGNSLRLSIPLQYPAAFHSPNVVLSSNGVVAADITAPVARADAQVKVWDAANGKLLHKLDLAGPSIFYSRDKRFLSNISIGENKARVTTWNPRTGKRLRFIDISAPTGLSFDFGSTSASTPPPPAWLRSADGRWIAIGLWKVNWMKDGDVRNQDKGVALYDARNGNIMRFLQGATANSFYSIKFSPDSQIVAATDKENRTNLWDTKTGKSRVKLKKKADLFYFSPDSSILASANYEMVAAADYQIKAIYLWSARSGKLLRTLTKFSEGVTGFVFSPDSRTLATGDYSGKVRLWRVK